MIFLFISYKLTMLKEVLRVTCMCSVPNLRRNFLHVFTLFRVCWTSWICRLMFFSSNLGSFWLWLFHMYSLPFFLPSFWDSVCVGMLLLSHRICSYFFILLFFLFLWLFLRHSLSWPSISFIDSFFCLLISAVWSSLVNFKL